MATTPRAGNVALWRALRADRLTMLQQLNAAMPDGVGIGLFRLGSRRIALVMDPEAVGEVLQGRGEDFHKGPALAIYSRPLLGNGLLTSEEDFHRRQRRLVAPAFAPARVMGYAGAMVKATQAAQARWAEGQTVDVAEEMTRLTLGIVGKTLFDTENVEDEADALGNALTTLMRYFTTVLRAPLRPPFPWIPFWRGDIRAALARLDATIYRLISERRASGTDRGDLLSMLLLARDESGEAMDDKQIRDEAMTLFLAGHETTANALAWTWYLLARHPEIYGRVQEEVDRALNGRLPTYSDLASMPYTLQVHKEAMRLYPPAYALARQTMSDTVIAGQTLPAPTLVLISPYLLHHDPRLFPDPERFDPDRFTPNAEQSRPRYAYLPFGGGPRICIGAAFALMEGHLVLATLAQRVTFEPPPNALPVVPEPLITLRPHGGIPLVVRQRIVVPRLEKAAREGVAGSATKPAAC